MFYISILASVCMCNSILEIVSCVWLYEYIGVCACMVGYIAVICTVYDQVCVFLCSCVCVCVCACEVQVPAVLTGLLHVPATLDKPRLGLIL